MTSIADGFLRLLTTLDRSHDDVRFGHSENHDFATTKVANADIAAWLEGIVPLERNVWFEINPSSFSADLGRSSEGDITRLSALYVDVDFKPEGMGDLLAGRDFLDSLSGALGVPPAATVFTGHGMQAYWPISDGFAEKYGANTIKGTLKRFGVLAQTFAASHGGKLDPLFDLPRIFRVPGLINWKDRAHPAETSIEFDENNLPISIEELLEILEDYDIPAISDNEVAGEPVSLMDAWEWAETDCSFVGVFAREVASATPTARHGWGLKVSAILHGLIRNGCITEESFYRLRDEVFIGRFLHLVETQAPIRPSAPNEIPSMLRWGQAKAESWSDLKLAEETRQHVHQDAIGFLSAPVVPAEPAPTPVEAAQADAVVTSIFTKAVVNPTPTEGPQLSFGQLALAPQATQRLSVARYTDTGNAELLGQSMLTTHRHVANEGWYAWSGNRWQPDVHGTAVELVKDLFTQRANATVSEAERKHLLQSLSAGKIGATLKLAETIPHLTIGSMQMSGNAYELVTPSGVVDLRTGTLRPGDPLRDTHTAQASYDPDYAMPTPKFDAFMRWAFSNDERLLAYVQRLFGMAAIGKLLHHAFPTFLGVGANGKSTLFAIILGCLGQYAAMMPPKFLVAQRNDPHPERIARLQGIRAAFASEVPPNAAFDEELVKTVTGEHLLTGRKMYGSTFDFPNTTTFFGGMNHLPSVIAGGTSFWRRMRRIDMMQQMPLALQNPHLAEEILVEEGPGVMAWIVQGARALQAHGEQPPASVVESSFQYQIEEDAMARFFEEKVVAADGFQIARADLFEVYRQWCARQNLDALTQPKFAREITMLRPNTNLGTRQFFTNIAMRAEIEYAPED